MTCFFFHRYAKSETGNKNKEFYTLTSGYTRLGSLLASYAKTEPDKKEQEFCTLASLYLQFGSFFADYT